MSNYECPNCSVFLSVSGECPHCTKKWIWSKDDIQNWWNEEKEKTRHIGHELK